MRLSLRNAGSRRVPASAVTLRLRKRGDGVASQATKIRLTGTPNEIEVGVLVASLIGGLLVTAGAFVPASLVSTLGGSVYLKLWSVMLALGSAMALLGLWQPFRDPTKGASIKAIGLLAVATAMAGYAISVVAYSPRAGIMVALWTACLSIASLRRALVVFKAIRQVLRETQ